MYHDKLLYDAGYREVAKDREELRKRGVGPQGLDRVEFGTVETHLGTVVLSHSRGADLITIHGVTAPLADIKRDLRSAVVATSAAFSAAQTAEEQSGQKAALAAVIDAVLRETPWLAAKVREAV